MFGFEFLFAGVVITISASIRCAQSVYKFFKEGDRIIKLDVEVDAQTAFFIGAALGYLLTPHKQLETWFSNAAIKAYGYEYDRAKDCIVERGGAYGDEEDFCRPPVDCSICRNVDEILLIDSRDFTEELFAEKYASGATPIVVRNLSLTADEKIFTIEFFKRLYDAESPVMNGSAPGCEFFSWDFGEFENMRDVFKMDEERAELEVTYDPWYVGWTNCDKKAMKILTDKYLTFPDFLPSNAKNNGSRIWFFLGTEGFGAPFHIDQTEKRSWQAQVTGVKQWKLKPPKECRRSEGDLGFYLASYRSLCRDDEISVDLHAGDMIIVNTDLWEHSTLVKEGLSVSITGEY